MTPLEHIFFANPSKVGRQTVRLPGSGLPPTLIDRDLTCHQDGLRWSFSGGKVCIDGQDVNRLLSNHPFDIGFWMGLADGITEYRKKVMKTVREADQLGRFLGAIEALLGKIMGKLQKAYDQKISGLSWSLLQDGQLVLNGINVRSFLALYRVRKTEKAKKFLEGLQSKLKVLLENHQHSADYERIRGVVEELYWEVDEELNSDATSYPVGRYLSCDSRAL